MIRREQNPLSGRKSPGYRFRLHVRSISHKALFLPLQMKELPEIQLLMKGESLLSVFNKSTLESAHRAFHEFRYAYDFTFWAAREFFIHDIEDADQIVTLRLNTFQHYIIDTFLKRLFKKKESRYIISKHFRSCGVTTCVQAYILWLQLYHMQKHSNTCTASDLCVRQLKSNLLRFLHREYITPERALYIPKSDSRAFFNTYRTPDALRGIDFAFVHFADMSKWGDPDDFYSSRVYSASTGGVLPSYRTLVVMEGNVPRPETFHPNEYDYRHNPYARRPEEYTRICRNPFFLQHVADAASSTPSFHYPYIHIDLSLNFFPLNPPLIHKLKLFIKCLKFLLESFLHRILTVIAALHPINTVGLVNFVLP